MVYHAESVVLLLLWQWAGYFCSKKKIKLELVSNRLMDVEEDGEHISIKDICNTFYNFDLFIF